MTSRLAGKTALISGGASGQGAAHARRLAEDGASVVLGDILVDAGEAHADALRAAGHAVHFVRLDATSPSSGLPPWARPRSGSDVSTCSSRAVIAMTNVAALEHGHEGHRMNAICPGPVRSPMSAQEGDASVDVTPLRRRAEPEEISSFVSYVASDDAIFITGAELAIGGGYLAR